MLVWICIIGSLLLYFLVGYHVFRSRNRLRSFSTSKSREAGHHENVGSRPMRLIQAELVPNTSFSK